MSSRKNLFFPKTLYEIVKWYIKDPISIIFSQFIIRSIFNFQSVNRESFFKIHFFLIHKLIFLVIKRKNL